MHAVYHQTPVIMHNLINYMEGKELNGIYNGYSYMPFYMGHSHANSFQHFWDYEAAPNNFAVPSYGWFAKRYFSYQMGANLGENTKFSSFKKDMGPPYRHFPQDFDPIEHNEYLQGKGVDVQQLRSIHNKAAIETA